ncbi:hypothetical protein PR048_001035 [Dryococelus australis]|uniref:Reverse transcriptase RNase H-like domain-containing protein n=1 Tax=Dryococelus australis TaxID=614101 RepID=A0ABQ9IG77_9NEOP|nr:hypothetical protein PR048_001035 [Dryococelus australis]
MDRLLCPEQLNSNPENVNALQEWSHWIKTLQNFIVSVDIKEADRFKVLVNFVSPAVFEHIRDSGTYNEAIAILENIYAKSVSEVFARHKITTRCQEPGESVNRNLESLKLFAKECKFKVVTADINRDEYIQDTVIDGLQSHHIRQRLLENRTLLLEEAFAQARSLELTQHQSQLYLSTYAVNAVVKDVQYEALLGVGFETSGGANNCSHQHQMHPRAVCPVKEAICRGCSKKVHFVKLHQNSKSARDSSSSTQIVLLPCLLAKKKRSWISASFINEDTIRKLKLPPRLLKLSKASIITLCLRGYEYKNITVSILPDVCSDIIVGPDILKRYSNLQVTFGGEEAPRFICGVAAANVEPVQLFNNLSLNCKPISIKSRGYTASDLQSVDSEIQNLLKLGIIEKSVMVVTSENHRHRMAFDYSQTINRYTKLDAFPLPDIEDDIVNKVTSYKIYSHIYSRSASYQPYTAFEASGQLYQFTLVPVGIRNGVPAFQQVMQNIVQDEDLKAVEVYLDDPTVGGLTQEEDTIPDPDRLKPLRNLPVLTHTPSLHRAQGMFLHFAHFIPIFAEKLECLMRTVLSSIDDEATFTIETDASDFKVGAILSRNNHLVAFFSTSLSKSEQNYSSIEKEAYAIMEALRKWRRFLMGRHFRLVTDQHCNFKYDIIYRPGKEEGEADILSRIFSSIKGSISRLFTLHETLSSKGDKNVSLGPEQESTLLTRRHKKNHFLPRLC